MELLKELLFESYMSAEEVAKKVARDLVNRYGYYTDSKPVIHKNDDESYVVSWDGPTDWAMNDPYWFHEEIADMASEFGGDTEYNPDNYKPFYDEVRGFSMEPETGYSLSIRKD